MSRYWPHFYSVGFAFVLLFLMPAAALAANLLTNPGFDEGPPGADVPPGWAVYSGQMGREMWVEPAGVLGASQVLIVDTGGTRSAGLRSDPIPAAPGERYQASARIYASPGNRARLYIEYLDANKRRVQATSVANSRWNQWEMLSVSLEAPEGTRYVSIILHSNSSNAPNRVAWDNAVLEKDMSYVVRLSPDHSDHLYEVGETAVINVKILQGDQPAERVAIQYRITLEDGTLLSSGVNPVQNGETTVQAAYFQPGFVRVQITAVGSAGSTTETVVVGFSPDQIRISTEEPEDFDEFWAAKKAELAAIPPEATVTPIPSGAAGIEAYDVQVRALGNPVSGIMAKPAGAEPGTLPAIITLHGAGVFSARLEVARDWAREGLLAMDINAHGIPNNQPPEYYTNLAATTLEKYYTIGREDREEFYFLGMFLRIVRAIDFITSQPEWDGKTLILTGGSQGGAQTLAGAGLDERVTFFAAAIPWLADFGGPLRNRPMYTDLTAMPVDQANRIRTTIRYFDTALLVSRTKADGFFTVGFLDPTCPPTTVYAAKNAVKGRTEIFNDPLVAHTSTPEAQAAVREAILRHVAEMKTM